MCVINLEDLQPDMLLADDVHSLNGRVLLRSGSRLTEKHLGIFKAWGVTEADISGVSKDDISDSTAEEIDPQVLSLARESAEKRFHLSGTAHPLLEELFRIITFRTAQRLQG